MQALMPGAMAMPVFEVSQAEVFEFEPISPPHPNASRRSHVHMRSPKTPTTLTNTGMQRFRHRKDSPKPELTPARLPSWSYMADSPKTPELECGLFVNTRPETELQGTTLSWEDLGRCGPFGGHQPFPQQEKGSLWGNGGAPSIPDAPTVKALFARWEPNTIVPESTSAGFLEKWQPASPDLPALRCDTPPKSKHSRCETPPKSKQSPRADGPPRLQRLLTFDADKENARAASPSTPVVGRRHTDPPGAPKRPSKPFSFESECEDPNENRFRREFTDISCIGSGEFSSVYRARNVLDQQFYAVKKLSSPLPGSAQARNGEVLALASVAADRESCPNLVRYFSAWSEDSVLHIQTELCERSLRDSLAQRALEIGDARFSEQEVTAVLEQVACGLAALHRLGLAHMDIKPENILIRERAAAAPLYKIGDFGLVTSLAGLHGSEVVQGDCRYVAKECLNMTRKSETDLPQADVFSLGLVSYELTINPQALPQNGDEWQDLRQGHLKVELMAALSAPLLDLIQDMVQVCPSARPRSEDIAGRLRKESGNDLQAMKEALIAAQDEALRCKQDAEESRAQLRRQNESRIAAE
eukprot:CAMPEP_0170600528 /NCGR_PEP_ID=MMETSP0224-20130122/17383_1 /TAXON_ID=285029 /ORGANISM="Togula jolla, Strain CCCM 725" /LENGTH=585 /DNA_ID=CAMNT_0010925261 /DNA_START=41 /DNA_END=1798 /DNA_ORIENTATION=-